MFNKGDKVTIVPNESHADLVKKEYNKVLTIERVISGYNRLYKVKGIKDYATDKDLAPVSALSVQIRRCEKGFQSVNPSNTEGLPASLLMNILLAIDKEIENYNSKKEMGERS